MSTKNENIEDAVYEEVNNSQEKVNYEINVEFTENFLEKNPTIKSVYNKEKNKLNIGLLPNVDKEFVEQIVGLIPELNSNEIVLFNPLIQAINDLASQDFITEDDVPKRMDYEEDKDFNKRKKIWLETQYRKITDINKSIGSFNTSLKTSKKTIKDPLITRGKKIDALYNALASFSENRKEIAKNNFPKYLVAQQKIKEAQEAKKNAAAIAEKEALEAANKEQTEKIEALSKKSSYADLAAVITDYFDEKQEAVNKANKVGLEDLLKEINAKTFDFSGHGELEQIKLEKSVKMFREVTVGKIEKALQELETHSVQEDKNDSVPSFNTEVTNDEENFADIIRRFNSIKGELEGMKQFTDPRLAKINDKLFEQIDIIKKTNNACIKYIGTVQEKYNSKK